MNLTFIRFRIAAILTGLWLIQAPPAAFAQAKVVISQVYGGAGCGTSGCSSYQNDFIEIFNSGNAAQSLNGWSIQYSAATGTAWQVTNLTNFTLQPGQYYLIGEGAGANGVSSIPTPDASGTVAMSATAGKVALVNSTTALSGTCPASTTIQDFIGYGATASCNEGGANAPSPSTTTAAFRAGNGCTDANNNSTDFSALTANPRNSATTAAPCPSVLPVSFVAFTAHYQETTNSVILKWSTVRERDAREFIAERSTNGKIWAAVQQVAASGNTDLTTQYQATDTDLQQGLNLYRIRQVDIDGRSQYTGTISVKTLSERSYFNLFPNPTTGIVYLNATLPSSVAATIRVTDLSGRVLLQEQRLFNSAQRQELDLSRLAKGTYFLTLSCGAFLKTEKVSLY